MTKNIFIMAAGKSSRFNYKPKLNYTFNANYFLLKRYFDNIFIVTTPIIYTKLNDSITMSDVNFLISDKFSKGSGKDVYTLWNILNRKPLFICWSDIFLNEENIESIVKAAEKRPECNILSVAYTKNPYVNIEIKADFAVNYVKDNSIEDGYQDNSIFYINNLNGCENVIEFMDFLKCNQFRVIKTSKLTKYFNTKEELENIRSSINF